MTVNSTTSRVSYAGNGSTTAFSVPFYFLASADLVVIRTASSGAQTTLVLNSDYTVSGAGNPAGGTVTCTTAPSASDSLVIFRDPATTQLTDYQANDPFPAETHERALDKLTMLAQRMRDLVTRSFRLSDGDTTTASTTLPSPQANNVIGWNATATGLQNVNPQTLATIVSTGTTVAQTFTGNGTQTSWTLASNPGALANLDVSIGGVTQVPGVDYLWTSGTTLTTTSAVPNGVTMLVRYTQALPQGTSDSASATFVQAGPGAVTRTAQSKMRDVVSVTDAGIVADATDKTAAIVAYLTGLGATWEGVIVIPGNIRFDFNQVIAAVPYKAIVQFTNTMQIGSGYRQQLTGIISRPPDANTDTAFAIIDPHYPDLMLNNPRTAGTVSATKGLSGFSWARGFYANGSKGPRVQWQSNFTKSSVRTAEYSGQGVACYEVRTRSPERAGNYEEWFNGIAITAGQYILATNGYYYRATTSGTSTVSPTHTSGSATVGGITWAFESAWVNFRVNFYFDELGRIGTNACDTGYTQNWEQNPEDPEDFNAWWVAKGTSKRIRLRYQPTNSGGTNVTAPITDITDSAGIRMLDSALDRVLYQVTDASGFQLGTHGRIQVTATNGATTPSVKGVGRLVFSNTGATSVTNLADPLPTQEVELYFANGNTTLVHSSSLYLRGLVNVTPINGGIIVVTRDQINGGWVEKSRNF